MVKVITFANQKGGVGKTSLAFNIGCLLKEKGNKIMFLDLDQQANLTNTLVQERSITKGAYELITNTVSARQTITNTDRGDIIQASPKLLEINSYLDRLTKDKSTQLKRNIKPILKKYDYVIVDTPPESSLLVLNALAITNYLIAPAQTSSYSLKGVEQLDSLIQSTKKNANKDIKFLGILLNMYDTRTTFSSEITDRANEIAKSLNTKVFKTVIRRSIDLERANDLGVPINEYSPKNNVSKDLEALLIELDL